MCLESRCERMSIFVERRRNDPGIWLPAPFKYENRKASPKNLKSFAMLPWKDLAEHFLATYLNTEKCKFN